MTLTVKGSPISGSQQKAANDLLAVANQLQAGATAATAMIYSAIWESQLTEGDPANPQGYGGVLAGSTKVYSVNDTAGQAHGFLAGDGHRSYQGPGVGGAIAAVRSGLTNPVEIAIRVQVPSYWPDNAYARESGYPGDAAAVAEAAAIVKAGGAGTLTGGTAGLGGTGSTPNKAAQSPWQVGSTANPDEDYFTAINRLVQGAQWYGFSDGETFYVADGTMLMQQIPAMVIDLRSGDVLSYNGTWDNTAFAYAAHHKRKGRIQRKARLAKVTSPVEITLELICDIDELRAGDVVYIVGHGPGDGRWLVGDTRRSVFTIFTEITLVPALSPINAALGGVGTASGSVLSGAAASKAGAGTVIAGMISMAATINNKQLPYIWGGGHARAGTPDGGSGGGGVGFDCSGCVAAVLSGGGLWPSGSSVPNDAGVVQQLQASGYLVPGLGSGSPECTIFDNPGVHIFMRMNGQYFGTSDGLGGPHNVGPGGKGGGGGTWLTWGPDVNTFQPYHVPASILGRKLK